MAELTKPSAVLRAAKRYLIRYWREVPGICSHCGPKRIWICAAVNQVDAPIIVRLRVTDHISQLLGIHHSTYESWLQAQGIDSPSRDFAKLQRSRLAWMDDMIAYWKAKGL